MFEQVCNFVAENYGRPGIPFVIWSGAIEDASHERLEEVFREHLVDKVIEALTKDNTGGH